MIHRNPNPITALAAGIVAVALLGAFAVPGKASGATAETSNATAATKLAATTPTQLACERCCPCLED